jgi:hypothetical protein
MFRDKLSRYWWRTFAVGVVALAAVVQGALWAVQYVRRMA